MRFIWIDGHLKSFYIIVADNLPRSDIGICESVAKAKGYTLMSRTEFIEKIFIPFGYQARAKIVGFNLPFDLSRQAISCSESAKYPDGFSVKLSEKPWHPAILIKGLNSKASFIEFAAPMRQESEKKAPPYKGCFIDLKTATFALTGNSYTLERAQVDFGCMSPKEEQEIHGQITPEYVEYNIEDTLGTHELYEKVEERRRLLKIDAELSELFSPATVGKHYFKRMGIKSFFNKNPNFPKKDLGYVMSSYLGGLVRAPIRLTPKLVTYLDATSLYPTLYVLLNMDRLLKAAKIEVRGTTGATQRLLDKCHLEVLQEPQFWNQLCTICRIKLDNDLIPVRSRFGDDHALNIGLCYVTSTDDTELWVALPDLIASKLRTGKTPVIAEALTFIPKGVQEGLREIGIADGTVIKPDEDIIKKLVETRLRIKKRIKQNKNNLEIKRRDEVIQHFLKIVANATSYGEFIEVNTEPRPEEVTVYGLSKFGANASRQEREGKAYNSIMAAMITASARMLIAGVEALVKSKGGYLAYSDTDSAFISPQHVKLVQDFFRTLNPYDEPTEVMKIEEDDEGKPLSDVWLYAISSKRYVLYDCGEKTRAITIRKCSSHALGQLQDIDEEQWWLDILIIYYHPEKKNRVLAKYKERYAISRMTIRKASDWKRFSRLNEGKPYEQQVKPFNFVTIGSAYRRNPATGEPIIPMLPYDSPKLKGKKNPSFDAIPYKSFIDYKSGERYPNGESFSTEYYWRPLVEEFDRYRTHPESKFKNDGGRSEYRHLELKKSLIRYVGKETNNLDEAEARGVEDQDYTFYNEKLEAFPRWEEKIMRAMPVDVKPFGITGNLLWRVKRQIKSKEPLRLSNKVQLRLISYLKSC